MKEMRRVSSLANRQGRFNLLKIDFFTIFARTLPILTMDFPNITVSKAYLETPPHKKFFLTLVNG